MSSVLTPATPVQPTCSAPLVLFLVWLLLAGQGSGRPHHLRQLADPLLAAMLGVARLPTPQTLHRSLTYFAAHAIRAAVEAAYQAELPQRPGRLWVALDSHRCPTGAGASGSACARAG